MRRSIGTEAPLPPERVLRGLDNRRLELIVFPTEHCNFRCVYCYEDFAIGRMSAGTVSALKNLIARRANDLDELHISWFGGEPLVASDIIFDVCAYSAATCRSGVFSSSITTNGYQLEHIGVRRLVDAGVEHFQISFDGMREVHDKMRLRADGKGTFDAIWSAVKALADLDAKFECTLRVHVTPKTAYSVTQLVEYIASEFDGDRRFSVFMKQVERFGGPNDAQIVQFGTDEFHGFVVALRERHGLSIDISCEHDVQDSVCYAARLNSFVIRADGRVQKCTIALNDPRNTVGQLGPDGAMNLDRTTLMDWAGGLFSLDADRMSCPLHHLSL